MLHKHVMTVGLVLALLCLASTVVFAQSDDPGGSMSPRVVATITALDARTSMATLQTEAGETFELPKASLWHVGHKVICEQFDAERPRWQDCRLWESAHRAGEAAAQPSRVDVPSAREGRFLAMPTERQGDRPASRAERGVVDWSGSTLNTHPEE